MRDAAESGRPSRLGTARELAEPIEPVEVFRRMERDPSPSRISNSSLCPAPDAQRYPPTVAEEAFLNAPSLVPAETLVPLTCSITMAATSPTQTGFPRRFVSDLNETVSSPRHPRCRGPTKLFEPVGVSRREFQVLP